MNSSARGSGPRWRGIALIPAAALCLTSAALSVPGVAHAENTGDSDATCATTSTGGWRAPVRQAYVITSTFGERTDPINGRRTLHAGVDLAITSGPGPVVAAASGTVVRSGPYGGLGNEVTLQHPNGVQTLYGHMSQIDPAITPGATVTEGQVLGTEGSTGHSTGPHVHFEVHVDGKPVDPLPFMATRGAPLGGKASSASSTTGVALPAPDDPRQQSRHQDAAPVPADLMKLYVAAAGKYSVPWQLLAAIGMEETAQGRNNQRSSAGALGLMQFLPSTFARYGVDGDGDGKAEIDSDADSIYSAANALHAWGVGNGPEAVRTALFRYNHAHWYVNDVLYYAAQYAQSSGSCVATASSAPSGTSAKAVAWASAQVGHAYRFGADGPDQWDSSSFVQAAYRQAGVTIPRTATAQRDWLAAGHGHRVKPAEAKPGDLIFENSYRGPDKIGFVMLVTDPPKHQAVAARNSTLGVAGLSYAGDATRKHIFEVWRVDSK